MEGELVRAALMAAITAWALWPVMKEAYEAAKDMVGDE